jgi:hypothetical protein
VYTSAFSEWDDMFADLMNQPRGASAIFHYEFMRIGEDYEDVVYDRSYGSDHALNMSRESLL